MAGLKRNLRYWMSFMQRQMLAVLLGIVAMLVAFSLLWGENILEIYLERMPMYLAMMIMITILSNAYAGMTTYFPMTISLGSDRKSSLIAMVLSNHLMQLELVLVCILPTLPYGFHGDVGKWSMAVMLALALAFFMLGLGAVISILAVRASRTVVFLVYVLSLIITILGVIVVLILIEEQVIVLGLTLEELLMSPLFLVIGIVFDVVMECVMYKVIRNKDLQFT